MKPTVTHIVVSVCLALICSALLLGDASWQSDFDPITLPDITSMDAVEQDSDQITLNLTEDVEMSADNSTTARLDGPVGDWLRTRYQLTFDGDGVTASGASDTNWNLYDQFLNPSVTITHVPGDDIVLVRLRVLAANRNDEVSNAGLYTATQTLTATWVE